MRFDIAIPQPCLVVLVGAAGSGKSTFAARHFGTHEVLASDAFRARLGRGEADQAVSRRAFGALHAALEQRLAGGRTAVVDATNVQADARRPLLRRASAAGVPAIAIVLDLPLEDCLAADRSRVGRHVPVAVIGRQWAQLRASLDGPGRVSDGSAALGTLAGEGFAATHRLTSRSAVDSVRLTRDLAGWPTLSRAPRSDPRRRAARAERHSRTAEDVERA